MTTTNRHGTKTSTTFSVFLLTGILQKLILRFADFGGNVVAPGPVFLFRGNDRLRNHVSAKHQNQKEGHACGAKMRCQAAAVKPLQNEKAGASF